MVEAKTIIPNGLSIRSGKSAPIARYLGSMIVFNRGAKYENIKNIPSVTPICPNRSIIIQGTSFLIYNGSVY
jgi:hypothetical protein